MRGAGLGLLAAVIFGASAPLAKLLLPQAGPVVVAGLLYLGAGLGLSLFALVAPRPREAPLRRADVGLLAAIVLIGGALAPLLMLFGLERVSGMAGSLLLNLEAPFTMLLAALLFGEHLGRRAALAAALIVLGAAALTVQPGRIGGTAGGAVLIAAACLAWAVDNNLSQRLSLRDPVAVARLKGLGAGACTLGLAAALGEPLPRGGIVAGALALGVVSYGVSVVLHLRAMRELGAARQAALFATAPFAGALLSVPILGERAGLPILAAFALMAAGVSLLVRERHAHLHTHEELDHDHRHVHDVHHQHAHEGPVPEPHSHPHHHPPLTHDHPHLPDLHHRHRH